MWYDTFETFVCAFSTDDMSGCTGWQWAPEVITEPLEDKYDRPIYQLIGGHVVRAIY